MFETDKVVSTVAMAIVGRVHLGRPMRTISYIWIPSPLVHRFMIVVSMVFPSVADIGSKKQPPRRLF